MNSDGQTAATLLGITVPAGHDHPLAQRLNALALTVQQQALQIHPGPLRPLDMAELTGELGRVRLQPLQDRLVQLRDRSPTYPPTLRRFGRLR